MSYVDGFLVPVRKNKVATYRRMAAKAGKIWREHGALEFRECIADDVKWGKRTSFRAASSKRRGRPCSCPISSINRGPIATA